MSHPRLPVHFDPWRLAENSILLEGELAVASMERLLPSLAAPDGMAQVKLRGERRIDGKSLLHIEVRCELVLQCQRCLQPMVWLCESSVSTRLVSSHRVYEVDEEAGETLEVGDEPLHLLTLVEDELILALPLVPKHEALACPKWVYTHLESEQKVREGTISPFAVLRKH
jgi:uncharacterized protein